MYISVVSHGHGEIISRLNTLSILSTKHDIILTDNVGEMKLKNYCLENGIHYIFNEIPKGFGENNNQNYKYAEEKLGMISHDYFLVMNPDVKITSESLAEAERIMAINKAELATINLYKTENELDANIRKFPKIFDFIKSYIYRENNTILDKKMITDNCYVDWASGSFLIFKSKLYKEISGFDTKFFMYCEDLDICRRALTKAKQKVLYIGSVKAMHIAAHNNRKFFSKHFIWHVKSVLRYCFLTKY